MLLHYHVKKKTESIKAGEAVKLLLKINLKPKDIVTRKSLENAATIVAATGGSTNAALHLPAIANEIDAVAIEVNTVIFSQFTII